MVKGAGRTAAILSFPHPVNDTSARIVATGVVGMTALAVAADQPWVMLPLSYGFAARVATGPRLSPLGLLATRVVEPRLPGPRTFSPGPPKRFAQAIGLAFSATALVLHYRLGRPRAARAVLSLLLVAASLEAGLGLCVGCKLFALAMRAGVVPEDVCEECADIWSRRPVES